jgi:hypothetical protein
MRQFQESELGPSRLQRQRYNKDRQHFEPELPQKGVSDSAKAVTASRACARHGSQGAKRLSPRRRMVISYYHCRARL